MALPANSGMRSQNSFNQAAVAAELPNKQPLSIIAIFLLSRMYVLIMVCYNSSLCVILSSVNSQRAAPRGAAGEDSLHVVARTGSKGTDGERIDS